MADTGDTLSLAKSLGDLTYDTTTLGVLKQTEISETVGGSTDVADYYQFTLTQSNALYLDLSATTNTRFQILNSAGTAVATTTAGSSSGSFKYMVNLDAGTYYLKTATVDSTERSSYIAKATLGPTDTQNDNFSMDVPTTKLGSLSGGGTISKTATGVYDWSKGLGSGLNYYENYTFTLTEDAKVKFALQTLKNASNVWLSVSSQNGSSVGDFSTSDSKYIEKQLLAGTYTVTTRTDGANTYDSATGTYGYTPTKYTVDISATAVNTSAVDTGNTLAAAKSLGDLTYDTTTLGVLKQTEISETVGGSTDVADYYQFTLTQSNALYLDLSATTNTRFQILNSAGTAVATTTAGSSSGSFKYMVNLDAGTYYLKTATVDSTERSSYIAKATLGPTDTQNDNFSMDVPTTKLGSLSGGGTISKTATGVYDWSKGLGSGLNYYENYTFTLTEDAKVKFALQTLKNASNVWLSVSSQNGSSVGDFSTSDSKYIEKQLLAGTYTVTTRTDGANTYDSATGTYGYTPTKYTVDISATAVNTSAVDTGNTLAAAKSLGDLTYDTTTLGVLKQTEISETVGGSTDVADYYQFTLTQSNALYLDLSATTNTRFQILNSAGTAVATTTAGSSSGSFKYMVNLDAGTYYLKTATVDSTERSSYIAKATLGPTDTQNDNFSMDVPTTKLGSLSGGGTISKTATGVYDWSKGLGSGLNYYENYTFTLTEDAKVKFALQTLKNASNVWLSVSSQNGSSVGDFSTSDSKYIEKQLLAGTYTVTTRTDGANTYDSATGTYGYTPTKYNLTITSGNGGSGGVIAPTNSTPTGSVSISGTLKQGQTLTASNTLADADGVGTISYTWLSTNGTDSTLLGTGSTYTLSSTDVGRKLFVVASYKDAKGTSEGVSSSETDAVVALTTQANHSPTGSVTISGTAKQGQTLTASNTLADADGMGAVSYQWKAGDSNISGATGSTYTLTKSEVGKAITVVASYTDGASTAESVSSGQTSTVTGVANISVKVSKVIAAAVPLYESGTSSTKIGIYQVTGGATYASQSNLTVSAVLPAESDGVPQVKILSASGGNWQPSTGAKILGVDGTSDSGAYVLEGMVSGKAYKSFAVWSFTDTADGTAAQASSATPQALDASSSQVTSYETMFEKDLNGDGSIGVNVTKVKSVGDEFTFIDANGEPATLGYFLGSDNYYYVAKSGLAVDDELTNANKLLTTKGKAWLPVSGTKTLVVKQTSDGAGYSIVGSGPNSQDVYTKFAKYDYVDNSTDHTTKPKSDKPTTITTAQVLGYEDELGLDINGDGAIGNSVSEVVFEGSAGKSIYSTGDGSYVIADAGLSGGDSLPSGYTPITVAGTKTFASQLQGEITGVAELSPSGYDLVSVKQVGSKLNYFSTLISEYGVAGKSKALTADKLFENERNYQQDLNGDGLIGDVVVDVVFAGDDFGGAWSLYQMSAGGYVIAEAGLTEGDAPTTGVSLRSGTKAWAPATGSKIAGVGETEQGNYELLTSATKGTTTTFSASVVSPDTGIVGKATVLTLAQLYAKEVTYGVDFTGDGDIGDLIESVIADNGTTGVYQMKSGAYVLGESGFGEGESTSGAVLMSGKAQWALGKGQTVEGAAVSEDGSKVSLLLETRSGLKITAAEQTFLVESGLAVGKAVTLSKPAQLQAAEIKYQVNLSDDDYIGVVTDGKEALVWDDGAGHVYALYKTPQTWANADKAAKALGGTLAVLTDDAMSFDFYANVSNAIDSTEYKKTAAVDGGGAAYVWLGATDDASSTSIKGASEGNWLWADGSELSTSRAEWGSGALGSEPDNTKVGSATQNYLAMGLENWPKDSADGAGYGDTGYWNDLVGSDKLFYVVEWTIA